MTRISSLQPLWRDHILAAIYLVLGRDRSRQVLEKDQKLLINFISVPLRFSVGQISKKCAQVSKKCSIKIHRFVRSVLGDVGGLSAINPRGSIAFRSQKPAGGWGQIRQFKGGLIPSGTKPVIKNLFLFYKTLFAVCLECKRSVKPLYPSESASLFSAWCCVALQSLEIGLNPHLSLSSAYMQHCYI